MGLYFFRYSQKLQRTRHFDLQIGIYLALSVLLFFSGECYSNTCSGFYKKKPLVEKIDTQKNEIALNNAVNESFKKGSSVQEVESAFDMAAFGPLGSLYNISWNSKEDKFVATERASRKLMAAREAAELLSLSASKKSGPIDLNHLVNLGVAVRALGDSAVLVTSKNIQYEPIEIPIVGAIRAHFTLLYLQMVNWNYRLSGLEPNKASTSMIMFDEIAAYANKDKSFSFHLAFDKAVWQKYLEYLSVLVHEYNSSTSSQAKELALSKISQPSIPLLPFSGLAAAIPRLKNTDSIELKRYFKNDIEDPLSLTTVSTKEDFILRHMLIYNTVQILPENSLIEIHAHSLVHARAYTKLGFKIHSTITNEKYPEIEIKLLQGKREDILKKIQSILGTIQ